MIKRLCWLALLPGLAQADGDFARQWPLQLSRPDAGAYQVELDASVHAAAHWRDLRDVRVVDADGQPVASTVQPAASNDQAGVEVVALRWFALPPATAAAGHDLSVVVRHDADGSLVSVNSTAGSSGMAGGEVAGNSDPVWLIDLGAGFAGLRSLRVDFGTTDAALDLGYRLEGSQDLRHWQLLDDQVRLLQLRNQGNQLSSKRIAVAQPQRYLRLVPLQRQGAPALQGIEGEFAAAAPAASWQWLELQAEPGGNAGEGYLYRLQGRFAVQRLDLQVADNSSASWTVASRDDEHADARQQEPAWRALGRNWEVWQLNQGGQVQRSAPLALSAPVSDRQWRLQAAAGARVTAAPVLRLGYQPANVVFLDQGRAPYLLLAGNANQVADTAALEPMLAALRTRNGAQWQPAPASLGAGSERAGEAAYQAALPPRDWKNLLLWAVLVLGALIVAGFAFSLLRNHGGPGRPQ